MRKNFDIPSIRKRLEGTYGKKYWRSLEEIAETDEFQDFVKHEFPQGADQWLNPVTRRNFLKLMAASFAFGGLTACSANPPQKIVPYVRAPEELVPGKPLFFATAMPLGGVAMALLGESHEGRPTKVEGNPDHPASLGSTDALSQASVLNLYDPDRSQIISQGGMLTTWSAFVETLRGQLDSQRASGGAGLRIISETVTSPSLISLFQNVLQDFPQARWVQYDPINRDNSKEGAMMAFGEDVNTVYQFDQAEVIVSLDANFTQFGPGNVRYARDFTDKRRVREDSTAMNRLYVMETQPSATSTLADHRLPLSSAQMEAFARALAAELGVDVEAPSAESLAAVPENWLGAIARDLQANAGKSIVIVGENQAPVVHALAHAMNDALGNVGQTVIYSEPLEGTSTNQMQELRLLADDMINDRVEVLLVIDANPVYNAPADTRFAEAIRRVPFRAKIGLYVDETGALCEWNIPLSHYLESWFDARAYDGVVSLTQPLVDPLYSSKTAHQFVAAMIGQSESSDYDLVRDYWSNELSDSNFDTLWQTSLHDGFIADTAPPTKSVSVSTAEINAVEPAESIGLEINFRPDPTVWDGRFANNGWLQELPKPISKLTWENVAAISPATAEELNLTNGDLVELRYRGRSVQAPIWVFPGQADGTVVTTLGYGRTLAGRVGSDIGFSAYSLQNSDAPWSDSGAELTQVGRGYKLASTQTHYNMEGRDPVRTGTIDHFREDPEFVQHMGEHGPFDPNSSLMPGWEYNSYAWGMVVDLNTCNGCNACVVACQAENNIPVVGKDQVLVGREMQWMRIDSYFEGELDNPQPLNQPMLCQHCEQAPCELVCPVGATVHDAEGLNVMVYNRCVGTRYCSNNCPYKVRRFNFLDFVDYTTESLKGQRNPDVSVRVRGVMEKCTYCVQRISEARIRAKIEDRRIADGEVISACQGACPTKAIYFGDINDPDSEVAKLKAQPQNYGVLTELGTRPRTTYLAKFTNPNPELEDPNAHEDNGHG
ncbi:MAG: TAT-variant-translocated molybdopterin oxidoreductase [Anaerolineae bacterium]|nr:TAT-variant-translocated molybdopterin oxidoreductase [Anaerolineae bacterium]